MSSIRYIVTADIEHPKIKSFIEQKHAAERALEYWNYCYMNRYNSSKNIAIKNVLTFQKKIKVLNNLIKIYGKNPYPDSLGTFIGEVYDDRHDSDDPNELQISNHYKKAIFPYNKYGNNLYAAKSNYKIQYYIADGNGKYRFLYSEKIINL
jgi:hypothetical protein